MSVGDRGVGRAIRRGSWGRCPNCGRGHLFSGYLEVVHHCTVCKAPLGSYRTADGPAFITITIVGLLLIPILGWSYALFRPDPFQLVMTVGALLAVLTLVILRMSKGMFVGYLWATDEMDEGA